MAQESIDKTDLYSEGLMLKRNSSRRAWSGRKLLPSLQGERDLSTSQQPSCAGESRGRAHGWALGCGPRI